MKIKSLPLAMVAMLFCSPIFAQDAAQHLQAEAEAAATRAISETLENHEVAMIEFRRGVMGRAGLQLYVVFFGDFGQPMDYFVTDGKCTSSNKRLLKPWEFQRGQTGRNDDGAVYGDFVMAAASLDGTHGSSGAYIYCKTVDGKYKEWNGRYYISDAPMELTVKPLIIDTAGGITAQQ